MQRLEASSAVRPIYGSLGVKRLIKLHPIKSNGEYIYRLKARYNFSLSLVRSTEVLLPHVKINIVYLNLYNTFWYR